MNETTLSILETLIAACKGGEEGFQLAASEVKSSELQALFVGYSLQRSRLSRDLETAASALGRSVAAEGDSGENMADQTWMLPSDAVSARDEQAVLSECERGEDAAIASDVRFLGVVHHDFSRSTGQRAFAMRVSALFPKCISSPERAFVPMTMS